MYNVNSLDYFYNIVSSSLDYEAKRIAAKLRSYGITPTGNKNKDKAKLHEIELREAKQSDSVSNKLITVNKSKQDKIQTEKKEKREILNPKQYLNSQKAQQLLGEQIYIANQINKKKLLNK